MMLLIDDGFRVFFLVQDRRWRQTREEAKGREEMEANVNKSQQESVPPTGSEGHTQPVQISRVSSGPTPPDVMTMAKAIFASIAGSTPGTLTERGTSLNPDDVTR